MNKIRETEKQKKKLVYSWHNLDILWAINLCVDNSNDSWYIFCYCVEFEPSWGSNIYGTGGSVCVDCVFFFLSNFEQSDNQAEYKHIILIIIKFIEMKVN